MRDGAVIAPGPSTYAAGDAAFARRAVPGPPQQAGLALGDLDELVGDGSERDADGRQPDHARSERRADLAEHHRLSAKVHATEAMTAWPIRRPPSPAPPGCPRAEDHVHAHPESARPCSISSWHRVRAARPAGHRTARRRHGALFGTIADTSGQRGRWILDQLDLRRRPSRVSVTTKVGRARRRAAADEIVLTVRLDEHELDTRMGLAQLRQHTGRDPHRDD